jgi:hypothetical protein
VVSDGAPRGWWRWGGALVRDAALAGSGAILIVWHGPVGWHPLDASIVFDGAWRMLDGQLPWRDYATPNGAVPIVLQACCFALFGVSWSSYLLHAAIANALFGIIAHRLLRALGAPAGWAFGCALATTWVGYAPFGVPYMDQHAFLFSLLALAVAAQAAAARTPAAQAGCELMLGPTLLLAWLSKQIPSVLIAPLALWLALGPRRGWTRGVVAGRIALGLGLGLGVLLGALRMADIPWSAVHRDLFVRSAAIGQERIVELIEEGAPRQEDLLALIGVLRIANDGPDGAARWIVLHTQWIVILGGMAGLVWAWMRSTPAARAMRVPLVVAVGACVVDTVFIVLTNNHRANGQALLFVAAGAWATALGIASRTRYSRTASRVQVCLAVALVIDVLNVTWWINRPRAVHELDPASRAPAHPALAPLQWATPISYPMRAEVFSALLDVLHARERPFFLLGDTSVLYGLTRQPSLSPSLWLHPGLTMPHLEEHGPLHAWDEQLVARLFRHRVRLVVVERQRSMMGVELAHLPRLQAWLASGRGRAIPDSEVVLFVLDPEQLYPPPAALRRTAIDRAFGR